MMNSTRYLPEMRHILCIACVLALGACGTRNTPAPVTHFGLEGGASSAGVHTVSGGDTLWSIAKRYDVDMKDVIYVNNLRAPYPLEVGQRLTLPPPVTYKVRADDTLYGISRTFAVSMTTLARQNNLKPPYHIKRGQALKLPSVQPATYKAVQVAAATPGTKPVGPEVASKPVSSVDKKPLISSSTPARAGSKFIWPVSGQIISTYGPKKDGLHNDGINISARRAEPVVAAENGVVVYADDQLKGFGNLILIRHADRWMTAYGHLGEFKVKRGQEIRRGDVIGTVGSSGQVDSPQLHFEVRRGTDALNPKLYLAGQGS